MENSSFGLKNVTGNSTHKSTVEKGFEIFSACVFFSTVIVGLIGNGLVIFLAGCRMKTTVNSIWFLNLAIADFIFLLFSVTNFCLILSKQQTVFIDHFLFIPAAQNVFASIWFLVVISLDRCLCTWLPVWAQNNRTLRSAKIICIIIWVSSIGYILPYVNVFEVKGTNVAYGFIVTFLLPFLIVASSYIAIGVKIKRLKKRKQLRSYRLIITVILTFFICSFPQHVCWFWIVSTKNNNYLIITDQFVNILTFTLYLVNLNSSLNPFLYVFMCDDYKKKLKQSLVLVLETAFAEDHLDIKEMRQTQKDEQEKKTTLEFLEM
ncbi:C3a anaphylatoxin chemotactic receptor-like [Danio aesculapii]|uniref:C3a anaphylatoxin chemotactic receptor-like n=1 Tax=Danio aesculapii TaxID=1142201 RepID=UPI0024BF909C|nr:C3a anaphylatoxin chemotactic receptor-like [Danio aesculapii]